MDAVPCGALAALTLSLFHLWSAPVRILLRLSLVFVDTLLNDGTWNLHYRAHQSVEALECLRAFDDVRTRRLHTHIMPRLVRQVLFVFMIESLDSRSLPISKCFMSLPYALSQRCFVPNAVVASHARLGQEFLAPSLRDTIDVLFEFLKGEVGEKVCGLQLRGFLGQGESNVSKSVLKFRIERLRRPQYPI